MDTTKYLLCCTTNLAFRKKPNKNGPKHYEMNKREPISKTNEHNNNIYLYMYVLKDMFVDLYFYKSMYVYYK